MHNDVLGDLNQAAQELPPKGKAFPRRPYFKVKQNAGRQSTRCRTTNWFTSIQAGGEV